MPSWTEDQARAIYEPSGEGNILVSAAAGSGKTAVLVERIANMVTRGENPVSIDNLLVVTFTNAAAAEMKERIITRIGDAQRDAARKGDNALSRRLKEQIHLTSSADINTIDAFCLGVVRNNFHILGIDPNFSIMDENEGEMLMDDSLDELFMELYAEDNPRFDSLVKLYADNRSDDGLKKVLKKIYEFTRTFAEPLAWLKDKAEMYSADMTESRWAKETIYDALKDERVKGMADRWHDFCDEMNNISREGKAYWGIIWDYIGLCTTAAEKLSAAKEWDELYELYKSYFASKSLLGKAVSKPAKAVKASESVWREYNSRFETLRDEMRNLCTFLPQREKSRFNTDVHAPEMKEIIDNIVWLTELFFERYEQKKDDRNLKSFSDVEHLAYRLFSENENIRGEYSARYEEILIDEFQDTNGLQDAIFNLISRNGKNIFMVGDLKQSIYRFRGGDPMIFKGKSREYAKCVDEGRLITLSENFRSRMQVIESINAVFSEMMSDRVGDVSYTGSEMLDRAEERECYNTGGGSERDRYFSEFYRIAVVDEETEENEESVSAVSAEAAVIADRINELVKNGKVEDKNGRQRPIEYRDIVILMKSVKGDGAVIRDVLESRGVRAFVQKDEYFERREIKLMLSLISLINNHRQDIPLVAVMRSPIGNFTETDLARIKIASGGGSFYNAVKSYKSQDGSAETERLERKCRRFMTSLERWRGYVKRKSIASLIWTLYEETQIYDFLGALEGGEEAQANLKLLYERAKRYEASGFKGIFNFIRYIERIESRREDISGAQLINENHNVVRIMTIHKSKGLEFPIVFLARTTKRIQAVHSGDENRVVLHKDLGIGADYYNYEDMYYKKIVFSKQIRDENKRENLSEEMRLLYVAATRAREKLIVTASYSFGTSERYQEQLSEWRAKYSGGVSRFSASSHSFADWLMPVVQSGAHGWELNDVVVSSMDFTEEEKEDNELVIENPDELREKVREILEFNYKFTSPAPIPAKTSVTAIKEMADEERIEKGESVLEHEPVYMVQKPAFLREENMGARIGTAHHQVMAYLDLDKMKNTEEKDYEEFVQSEIERIAAEGQIEDVIARDTELTEKICENVCTFFRSGMGKEVLNARGVYRERPFEIEITAAEYDPTLPEAYRDERIVVQGIIDLYFEDKNGDIILVDYKTDKCATQEEQERIGRRYSRQIELYERAMEKILKRNVKEKYLYLFAAKNVLKL